MNDSRVVAGAAKLARVDAMAFVVVRFCTSPFKFACSFVAIVAFWLLFLAFFSFRPFKRRKFMGNYENLLRLLCMQISSFHF